MDTLVSARAHLAEHGMRRVEPESDRPVLVTLPERVTLDMVWAWMESEGYGDTNYFMQNATYELPLLPNVHRSLVREYGRPPVQTEHEAQSVVLTAYERHGALRLWPYYRGVDYSSLPSNTTLAQLQELHQRYERIYVAYETMNTTPPAPNAPPRPTERRALAHSLLTRELLTIEHGGVPPPTRTARRRRRPSEMRAGRVGRIAADDEPPRRRMRASAPRVPVSMDIDQRVED